jgi:hypothetical protein
MDELSTNVARVIVKLWKNRRRPIYSKDVYDQLVSDGATIQAGDMRSIFDSLLKQVFIRGQYFACSEGDKINGAMRIGWVNPVLVELFES